MHTRRINFDGIYTARVCKATSGIITSETVFHNVITDAGLDTIGYAGIYDSSSPPNLLERCYIGTGTTPEQFTDTALENAVTSIATLNHVGAGTLVQTGDGAPYWRWTTSYRFAAGTATGNFTEIGIGRPGLGLFSRALIKDSNGLPTTITVLSDEYLDVTYEVRVHIDTTIYAASVTLNGVTYTGYDGVFWINNPPELSPFSWTRSGIRLRGGPCRLWPGPPTDTGPYGLGGTGSYDGNVGANVVAEYNPGSYEFYMQFNFNINSYFDANIRSISISAPITMYRFIFDAPGGPAKHADNTATVGVKFSWGRYTP